MDRQSLHSLNESATVLWDAIGEDRFGVGDAASVLTRRFAIDSSMARRDAEEFVTSMVEVGALEVVER
jgi:hypothetical protein